MRLVIESQNRNVNTFLNHWLIPVLSSNLKSKVQSNSVQIKHFYSAEIYYDLLEATNYLKLEHIESSGLIILSIDSNKKNKENTAKLYDICSAVNYGSLSCPAIPIFTKAFDYFSNNFWRFYKYYMMRLLPCP